MPCEYKWKKMKYGQIKYSVRVEVCDEDEEGANAAAATEDDDIDWAGHAMGSLAALATNPHSNNLSNIGAGLILSISCKWDEDEWTDAQISEMMLNVSTSNWAGHQIGMKIQGCTEDIAEEYWSGEYDPTG